MTFKTRLIALSAAAGALLLTAILGAVLSPEGRRARERQQPLLAFPEDATIDEIRIVAPPPVGDGGGDGDGAGGAEGTTDAPLPVRITRDRERGWVVHRDVSTLPARATRVDDFVESIRSLHRVRTAATNPSLWGDFEVEDATAIRLELLIAGSDDPVVTYWGKVGPAGEGQYVRVGGADRVYMTDTNPSFYLDQDESYWVDRRLFPEPPLESEILRMQVSEAGAEAIDVARVSGPEGTRWQLRDAPETAVEQAPPSNAVRSILMLEGTTIRPAAAQYPEVPAFGVTLTASSGATLGVRFYPDGEGYVAYPGGGYEYTVSGATVDRVVLSRSDVIVDDEGDGVVDQFQDGGPDSGESLPSGGAAEAPPTAEGDE